MARKIGVSGYAAQGGKARAQSLSKEQRSEIARQAAAARWGSQPLPRATHAGELKLGNITIPCAVLEDGTRVFTQTGVFKAIGRTGQSPGQFLSRASGRDPSSLSLPVFLRAQNLKPFISAELRLASTPIKFVPQQGKNLTAFGFSADILPLTCQVFLDAERAGVLSNKQKHIAEQCHILIKGFALVGITALIDEATGYQDSRARDALAKILEAFVTKELRRWVSTFPADYYKELFRLRGWQFPTLPQDQQKRPVMVGRVTNDIVYARLAPGVREELHRLTPRNEKGRLKNKLFQRLTDDIGHPRLREHLASLVALMRAADDWDGFLRLLDRALPKYSDLPLFDGLER